MQRLLSHKPNQFIASYFLKTFVVSLIPTVTLALAAAHFFSGQSPSPYLAGDESINAFWQLISIGLIIPSIESFFLIYTTSMAFDAAKNHTRSALIGTIPLLIFHSLLQWQLGLVLAWFFFVQAYAYIELKKCHLSLRDRYFFITGIHGLHNSLAVLILWL